MTQSLILALLAVPLMLGSHFIHKELPTTKGPEAVEQVFVPPGSLLSVLSLGHQRLVADLLWLQAIQYYGDKLIRRTNQMPNLAPFFQAITDLDPAFERAYSFGAYALADDLKSPDQALALLEKGIRANPEAWGLVNQAGFISYFYLKNPLRAAGYFSKAAENPEAPPLARRLAARLYASGGDHELSLALWKDIYDTAPDSYTRDRALRNMLEIRAQIDLAKLEAAIRTYTGREKHPPARLDDLRAKDLALIPLDPLKRPYRYDPSSGAVSLDPWPWKSP